MTGRVVSIKNLSTATVLVERVAINHLYKKTFLRSKKYLVGDYIGVKLGDMVEIINCKPISGKKNWKIIKVIGKSLTEITAEKLKISAEAAISEVMPEKIEEEVASVESQESSEKEVKIETKNKKSKIKKGEKPSL